MGMEECSTGGGTGILYDSAFILTSVAVLSQETHRGRCHGVLPPRLRHFTPGDLSSGADLVTCDLCNLGQPYTAAVELSFFLSNLSYAQVATGPAS